MNKTNPSKIILSAIFVCLLLLLIASFVVEFAFKKTIAPERLVYVADGSVLRPPFPSSFEHLLGTDRNGNDLLTKLIIGFKYTFLIPIGATFLRMILATVCSLYILFFLKPIKAYIESFLTPFLYVPAFIFYFFLSGNEGIIKSINGEYFLIFYQTLVIVFIGTPPLLSLLMKEFEQLLTKDYVIASRLLGASKFHLFLRQLFPAFKTRFYVVFIQQTITTIILLIHLGVFQHFIGGKAKGGIIGDEKKFLSSSSEWGGMIGQSIMDMVHFPWLLLYPALAMIGLILLLNITIRQLERIKN
jgi:peptide/nickel transport system permease protein